LENFEGFPWLLSNDFNAIRHWMKLWEVLGMAFIKEWPR
jgi:hypothetical protein